MASKPKATRSSARTKTGPQVADPPAPVRTTRAVSKAAVGAQDKAPAKKAPARKPLVNRNTSPDPKPSGRSTTVKPAGIVKPTSTIVADVPPDSDREPIKVSPPVVSVTIRVLCSSSSSYSTPSRDTHAVTPWSRRPELDVERELARTRLIRGDSPQIFASYYE